MKKLFPSEVEKRIKAWADVTMLALDLKHAALRKRHPGLSDNKIRELVRKEISMIKLKEDE